MLISIKKYREPKKAGSEPNPMTAKVLEYWAKCAQEATGFKPEFTGRHWKAAKDLANAIGDLDECKATIGEAFRDPWFVKHQLNLWFVVSGINKFRKQVRPTPAVIKPAPAPEIPWLDGRDEPDENEIMILNRKLDS